jgi:hypothetical protein
MPKKPTKKAVPSKRNPDESLSLPERFYIESHGELSIETIAEHIGKPVPLVRKYAKEWLKNNPPKEPMKRGMALLNRDPKKGVTSMTEAASMVGDEQYSKYVTPEAINRAMADGNHDLAKELKKRYEEQEKKNRDVIRQKYSDVIHYIAPPDDDGAVY